jgi:hypothetical protein
MCKPGDDARSRKSIPRPKHKYGVMLAVMRVGIMLPSVGWLGHVLTCTEKTLPSRTVENATNVKKSW